MSDSDAGSGPIYVTLTATSGTITLGNTDGLTFFFGDGINDTSIAFTASTSAVNSALNGLAYQPLLNGNGGASLSITTNDLGNAGSGGALSDTSGGSASTQRSFVISVRVINDAPTLNAISDIAVPQNTAIPALAERPMARSTSLRRPWW